MARMADTHMHIHITTQAARDEVDALTARLVVLEQQGVTLMNRQETFDTALAALNTATNDVADDLTRLRAEVAATGVSAESLARLDANIARLQGLAVDPENPVPAPPA